MSFDHSSSQEIACIKTDEGLQLSLPVPPVVIYGIGFTQSNMPKDAKIIINEGSRVSYLPCYVLGRDYQEFNSIKFCCSTAQFHCCKSDNNHGEVYAWACNLSQTMCMCSLTNINSIGTKLQHYYKAFSKLHTCIVGPQQYYALCLRVTHRCVEKKIERECSRIEVREQQARCILSVCTTPC